MKIFKWLLAVIAAGMLVLSPACTASTIKQSAVIKMVQDNEAWIAGDELHIVYTLVYSESFGFQLEHLLTTAMSNGITKLVLHLDNGGGSAFVMFDVIDTLEKYQRKGLHITTVARGCVASAAVPLFLVGDTRITYPGTQFMIHPVGGWNLQGLPDCYKNLIVDLSEKYCKYLVKKTHWTWETARYRMMPEDPSLNSDNFQLWFNAEAALLWGFATEIEGAVE